MADHTYKVVEIVGSSPVSQEKAIENAINRANKSLENLDWFEIVSYRGQLENGKIMHHQVTMKVGFRLKD